MSSLHPATRAGRSALQTLLQNPRKALVGLDFDGTLSPIIDNPEAAFADPAAVWALGRVARYVGKVAIITGRPALTAVRLGKFREVPGLDALVVLGQYGVERWDARTGRLDRPAPPAGIDDVAAELPALIDRLGLRAVRVEHKEMAIGVHTRELPDPQAAFELLRDPLSELAARHRLHLELGKNVLEIRGPGIDKGDALRSLADEMQAEVIVFAGDDLGDLPAFSAVDHLRDEGVQGLLVCSASGEQDALAHISDVIVDGPSGIAEWLSELAEKLEQASKESGPASTG